jgi:hypothetical protein
MGLCSDPPEACIPTVNAWAYSLSLKQLALFLQRKDRIGCAYLLAQIFGVIGFIVVIFVTYKTESNSQYISSSDSQQAICAPLSPASQQIWLSSFGHWSTETSFKESEGLLRFYVPPGYTGGIEIWKGAQVFFIEHLYALKPVLERMNFVDSLLFMTTFELYDSQSGIFMRYAGETIRIFPKSWGTGNAVSGPIFKLINETTFSPFNVTKKTFEDIQSSSNTMAIGGLTNQEFAACGSYSTVTVVAQGEMVFKFNRTEMKSCSVMGYQSNDTTSEAELLTVQLDFRSLWLASSVNMGIIQAKQLQHVQLEVENLYSRQFFYDAKIQGMSPISCTDNSSCGVILVDDAANRSIFLIPMIEHKCKFFNGTHGCQNRTCDCGSILGDACYQGPLYIRMIGGVINPGPDGQFDNMTSLFQMAFYFNTESFFVINDYYRLASFTSNCSSSSFIPEAVSSALTTGSMVDLSFVVLYECTPKAFSSWVAAISTAYGTMASINTVIYALVGLLIIRLMKVRGPGRVLATVLRMAIERLEEKAIKKQKIDEEHEAQDADNNEPYQIELADDEVVPGKLSSFGGLSDDGRVPAQIRTSISAV